MPLEAIEYQGFAPDLPSDTPGIFLDSQNLMPTTRGFVPRRQLTAISDVLPAGVSGSAVCIGGYVARYLDGSSRLFAGTENGLYQLGVDGLWADVSRTSGAGFIAGQPYGDTTPITGRRWRFTQFGSDTLAVNGLNTPQVIIGPGAPGPPTAKFADLAGIAGSGVLAASLVATVGGGSPFSMLGNTNVQSHQLWWSAFANDTTWIPNLATQAGNYALFDTDGPLIALRQLGDRAIAYKLRSIYLGQYVGPPLIWAWQLLTSEVGAQSQEGVINLGDRHVFLGFDNFYVLDGAGPPRPIENNLRRWLMEDGRFDRNYNYKTALRWDRKLRVIVAHYASIDGGGAIDEWVAWNIETNKWTHGKLTIESTLEPELPATLGLTWDSFGLIFTNWDTPSGVTWDNPWIFGATNINQAVFLPDHKLYVFGSAAAAVSFKTGFVGSDEGPVFVSRLRPKFERTPGAFAYRTTVYKSNVFGSVPVAGPTAGLTQDGWIHLRSTARHHQWLHETDVGTDFEVTGVGLDIQPDSLR